MKFTIEFCPARYAVGEEAYCLTYEREFDNGTDSPGYYKAQAGFFKDEDSARKFASVVKEKNRSITFEV